ncbi:MAG: hypothetical protein CM15mP68_2760 [Pseudomonadota bacterium]|nr:MAG: hypothetical protein CM15mP68_2760 [Pseudomonadota bacterium]
MVFDTRPSRLTPKEFEQLAIHWQIADWSKQQMADQLGTVDRVVVSPGIELDLPILEVAREMDLPIVSDIDLFFEATTAPVIGVPGTNGKSTVVSLVGHILTERAKHAVLVAISAMLHWTYWVDRKVATSLNCPVFNWSAAPLAFGGSERTQCVRGSPRPPWFVTKLSTGQVAYLQQSPTQSLQSTGSGDHS